MDDLKSEQGFISLCSGEFQELLHVKPRNPNNSIDIIEKYIKKYNHDELNPESITSDFLLGFGYAIEIIESIMEKG